MKDKIIIPYNDVEIYIHNPIQKSIYNQRVEILCYDNELMKLNCILNDKHILLDPGEILIWKDLYEQAKFTKNNTVNNNINLYSPLFIDVIHKGELIQVKIPKREQIICDYNNKIKKVFIKNYDKRTKKFTYYQDGKFNEIDFKNFIFHDELLSKAISYHKNQNKFNNFRKLKTYNNRNFYKIEKNNKSDFKIIYDDDEEEEELNTYKDKIDDYNYKMDKSNSENIKKCLNSIINQKINSDEIEDEYNKKKRKYSFTDEDFNFSKKLKNDEKGK